MNQDLTTLGFRDLNSLANDRSKMILINELRRVRKYGDAPHVFPNGWYRIMQSRQLGRNQAKEATYLGTNCHIIIHDVVT